MKIANTYFDTIVFKITHYNQLNEIAEYLSNIIYEINICIINLELIVEITFDLKHYTLLFNTLTEHLYDIEILEFKNKNGHSEYELFNSTVLTEFDCNIIWDRFVQYSF